MVRLKAIHVPFGKTPNFSFQFLMVRLKVNNKIKARLELNKFQFLMVRLKGCKMMSCGN